MLHLRTIGPISITAGSTVFNASSPQACAALLSLVAERGKHVPRRTMVELLFPEATSQAGGHALRQLIYRLHKLGAIEKDTQTVWIDPTKTSWDVETVLANGTIEVDQLRALSTGYLRDYQPDISPAFDEWLEQHRTSVSAASCKQLVRKLRMARSGSPGIATTEIASACLALDPLNEEATLAEAESLVMSGSKAAAVDLLNNYIAEVGPRSHDLNVPPRVLRERVLHYTAVGEVPMVGRDAELATIRGVVSEALNGPACACFIWGASGIGKTRLLNEACGLAEQA